MYNEAINLQSDTLQKKRILYEKLHQCLSLLLLFCLSAANLEAKGTESLETFKPVESPFIRAPKKIKKTARIRIGIKLSPYEKIVVRGNSGKRKVSFRKDVVLKNI